MRTIVLLFLSVPILILAQSTVPQDHFRLGDRFQHFDETYMVTTAYWELRDIDEGASVMIERPEVILTVMKVDQLLCVASSENPASKDRMAAVVIKPPVYILKGTVVRVQGPSGSWVYVSKPRE